MLYKDILAWSEKGLTIDSLYPNDDWSPLQFSAAVGNLDALRVLISEGADVNYQSKSKAIPQLTALMIAVRAGHMDQIQARLMWIHPSLDAFVSCREHFGLFRRRYHFVLCYAQ